MYNRETEMHEDEFVLLLRFNLSTQAIQALEPQITSSLAHIPLGWSVNGNLAETIGMLMAAPKINGASMMYSLPIGDETEASLRETFDSLKEFCQAKTKYRMGHKEFVLEAPEGVDVEVEMSGDSRYFSIAPQIVFYGSKSQVEEQIREIS